MVWLANKHCAFNWSCSDIHEGMDVNWLLLELGLECVCSTLDWPDKRRAAIIRIFAIQMANDK
jgi:hypothetical protein